MKNVYRILAAAICLASGLASCNPPDGQRPLTHDPRAVMLSLSVVLAILAQSYDPEPPNAPVSEDELLRERENLDRRILKWREAIKGLFG